MTEVKAPGSLWISRRNRCRLTATDASEPVDPCIAGFGDGDGQAQTEAGRPLRHLRREATPAAPAFTDPSPQLLVKAQELYASLEYDKVIPLTEVLLQRDDLPLEGKLEAHRLNGSSKAIVQDPIDAEKPFRLLLRLRPNYDLPKDTAPKILAVFRKVQTEERALAQQAELFDREKKIEALKFLDEPPAQAKGGRPVPFSLRLRDPGSVVDSVTVPYRRSGERVLVTRPAARRRRQMARADPRRVHRRPEGLHPSSTTWRPPMRKGRCSSAAAR